MGFLADIIGAALLFLITQGGERLLRGNRGGVFDTALSAVMLNPFQHPVALLIVYAAVALAGWLIYLFNRRLFRQYIAEAPARKIATLLALCTAPYFFLLPLTWFI